MTRTTPFWVGNVYYVSANCRNCIFLKKLSGKKDFKKTDDGGVNYKYNYIWSVKCEKEGEFTVVIEGTANMGEVPSCSLWKPKYV